MPKLCFITSLWKNDWDKPWVIWSQTDFGKLIFLHLILFLLKMKKATISQDVAVRHHRIMTAKCNRWQISLALLHWHLLSVQKTKIMASSPIQFSQFSSVAQSCLTFCDPMNHSTPGLPVHHQLLEITQIHVHQVSDAIQPSHPLSSPSPPALNPSQHQGLFQWVNSSHEVAKVLEFQLQHQSFHYFMANR